MHYLQENYQNKFDISDSGYFLLLIFHLWWIEKLGWVVVFAISCLLVLLLLFRIDIRGGQQ